MIWNYLNTDNLIVFLSSMSISVFIILTRDLHQQRAINRSDCTAIQAMHTIPTPRIGGIVIITSLLMIGFYVHDEIKERFWLLTASVLPAAFAGLAEDLNYRVSPVMRLLATAVSSAVAIMLLGVYLPRTDLPGMDYLMLLAPFGWVFTIFACAGICNAFNLIDGLNGLSSSVGVITALGLAAISMEAGYHYLAQMNVLLVSALLGFLVFNFPFGKIFLGDAGAYAMGHMLAWFAIILIISVPELSTWAVLLVFFWPIADTIFAVYRRRRAGLRADMPDRLHSHHLVMRSLEIFFFKRSRRHVANPLATLIILPMAAAPIVAGVMFWDQPLFAVIALCTFAALFVSSFIVSVRRAQRRRWRL